MIPNENCSGISPESFLKLGTHLYETQKTIDETNCEEQDILNEEEGRPDDDITCLAENVHKHRWKHYLGKPPAFEIVGEEPKILGRKRMR